MEKNVVDAINYAYKSSAIDYDTAKSLIIKAQEKNVLDANKCAKIYSAIRSYKSGAIDYSTAKSLIIKAIG
jgi:hypothetical protein